ncbi:hypothetical protein B296_00023634 [Ensete ventricosum]|uniref:Uncharacterized protein n=1 Tax=Ensete ventricosum TaxID=4639 RepID=A0A427AGE1_ENSVE|nr:hypothetical protein B296_00023634 [Ensete ventricosum]
MIQLSVLGCKGSRRSNKVLAILMSSDRMNHEPLAEEKCPPIRITRRAFAAAAGASGRHAFSGLRCSWMVLRRSPSPLPSSANVSFAFFEARQQAQAGGGASSSSASVKATEHCLPLACAFCRALPVAAGVGHGRPSVTWSFVHKTPTLARL